MEILPIRKLMQSSGGGGSSDPDPGATQVMPLVVVPAEPPTCPDGSSPDGNGQCTIDPPNPTTCPEGSTGPDADGQ